MNRIVLTTRVSGDGSLQLNLPVGPEAAGTEVQVTVEPLGKPDKRPLLAADLLQSGLVGMWSGRKDIDDSREFARRLREQAQTRSHNP